MMLEPDGGHLFAKLDEGLSPGAAAGVRAAAWIAGVESNDIMVRALSEILFPLCYQRRARFGDRRTDPLRSLPWFPPARAPFLGMFTEQLVRTRAGGRHQGK